MLASYKKSLYAAFVVVLYLALGLHAHAQSNSASISGTVVDSSGAVVPNATVEIHNPVSHYDRSTTTDGAGRFSFANVPFNPYHLSVTTTGFAAYAQDIEIRSSVPLDLKVNLKVAGSSESVTVESTGQDLLENDPAFHTDVDRGLFDKLPLESQSSSLTSLVTLSTPGIAADSNGLFHGLGDHAENSFSVDGQPITDQVSKVFSNQLPTDSIQSMEVIAGAPPAEFGGKTSVVVNVTTRSGLGVTTPHGEVTTSYGTFGTSTVNADLAYGVEKWGNFVSLGGLNTGRFLDPPEFTVLHDKGNEENFFDRFDYKLSEKDSLQFNLGFTRSWFQTPNSFDQQFQLCTPLSSLCSGAEYAPGSSQINPLTGVPLGPTDQVSQIRTFNIAPSWTRLVNPNTVFTLGAFVRHDQYNYYPSSDPFNDYGPLQDETTSQLRFLTNAGIRAAVTYDKGIHNIKIGGTYEQTFLTENDAFGIVNPGLIPSCPAALAAQCAVLVPFDLTTGGQLYHYRGHTDVKELGLYVEDTINVKNWAFNLGLRGDLYNGLDAVSRQPEPRVGIAYNIKQTNTVLRVSYARTMESPFNENLVLSGTGCSNPVVFAVMTVAQGFDCISNPLRPGFRNEFHAGFQQAFSRYFVLSGEYIWKYTHNGYDFNVFGAGKYFVLSGEYIWKYTHNGYDFNVFGTTPITLPIEWHNSKIPGFALRASVPNFHGLSAFIVMSSVAARFNPPTVAGIAPPAPPSWFRIDHDEKFNQTTHIQYQPWKRGPWLGFNWRYDSGLVAGLTPCEAQTATCSFSTSINDPGGMGLANIPAGDIALVNNLTGAALTADQEFQSGITCNGVRPTPTTLTGSVLRTGERLHLSRDPAHFQSGKDTSAEHRTGRPQSAAHRAAELV